MSDPPTWTLRQRRDPERLLVMLHAYADEERGFAAFGSLLDPDGRFLVAAPRGPLPVRRAFGWYRMTPAGPDPETFFPALEALHQRVDALCEKHGLERERAVFGGFSQGAALALALSLGASPRAAPAGLLFMSGYLPEPRGLAWRRDPPAATRVLALHGSTDPVVVPERGRRAADALTDWGYSVARRELATGHRVSLEALSEARDWLADLP